MEGGGPSTAWTTRTIPTSARERTSKARNLRILPPSDLSQQERPARVPVQRAIGPRNQAEPRAVRQALELARAGHVHAQHPELLADLRHAAADLLGIDFAQDLGR